MLRDFNIDIAIKVAIWAVLRGRGLGGALMDSAVLCAGKVMAKEEQCPGGDPLQLLTLTGGHSPVFGIWASKEDLLGAAGRTKDDRCLRGWILPRRQASGFKSRTTSAHPCRPACTLA